MQPQDAVCLSVHVDSIDKADGSPLYRAIVDAARAEALAGATVIQGCLGYRQGHFICGEFAGDLPLPSPSVVIVVDTPDKINGFLPRLDRLIGSGLATMNSVQISAFDHKAVSDAFGTTRSKEASGGCMQTSREAVVLRVFISADDRYGVEEPVYQAIVRKAREVDLAGVTVLKGVLGFGRSSRLHQAKLFGMDERPVVIEICDIEEKVSAFLPTLSQVMESGLVTIERTQLLSYHRPRESYLQRLKRRLVPRPITESENAKGALQAPSRSNLLAV